MSTPREDFDRCAVKRHRLDGVTETYCGRETSDETEWMFIRPKHAIAAIGTAAYILPCVDCVKAIKKAGDQKW